MGQAGEVSIIAAGGLRDSIDGPISAEGSDRMRSSRAQLRVRVWQATDIADPVLAQYDRPEEDIRSRLPPSRECGCLQRAMHEPETRHRGSLSAACQ